MELPKDEHKLSNVIAIIYARKERVANALSSIFDACIEFHVNDGRKYFSP